jgi:hypothetical protein
MKAAELDLPPAAVPTRRAHNDGSAPTHCSCQDEVSVVGELGLAVDVARMPPPRYPNNPSHNTTATRE